MQPLPLTAFTVALVGILGGGTFWVSHPGVDIEKKLHELEAKALEAEHALESKVHDLIFGADTDGEGPVTAGTTKQKRKKLILVVSALAVITMAAIAAFLAWGPTICPKRPSSSIDVTVLEVKDLPSVDKVFVTLEVDGQHHKTPIATVTGGAVKTAFEPVSFHARLDKNMPAGKSWLNMELDQDTGALHRVEEEVGLKDRTELGHISIDLKDVAKHLDKNSEYVTTVKFKDPTPDKTTGCMPAKGKKPISLKYRCTYKK